MTWVTLQQCKNNPGHFGSLINAPKRASWSFRSRRSIMLCRWALLTPVAQTLLASWPFTRVLIRAALAASPSCCLSEIRIYGAGRDDPCIYQAWAKTIEACGCPLPLLWPWMVMHTLPKMPEHFIALWDIDGLSGIISSWSIDSTRYAGTLKMWVMLDMNQLSIPFIASPHVLAVCKGLSVFICVYFCGQHLFSLTNKSLY